MLDGHVAAADNYRAGPSSVANASTKRATHQVHRSRPRNLKTCRYSPRRCWGLLLPGRYRRNSHRPALKVSESRTPIPSLTPHSERMISFVVIAGNLNHDISTAAARMRVVVAICTFQRNAALKHLLSVLSRIAQREQKWIEVGVVVVDDSKDQQARSLVNSFHENFELGAIYRHSGARNISKARNLVLETAIETGCEWIAMTDDDCEPGEQWLHELLCIQKKYAADVVTGPLYRRAPASAPRWLRTQPFLSLAAVQAENGSPMDIAFTNNSLISSDLLRNNPDLRFDPDFGRIGGEDMVFYREVARRGFKMVFARDAEVYENEDEWRLTLSYQFRRYFWIGNSSVLTSLQSGVSVHRMAIHSAASLVRAIRRPIVRLFCGKSPQILYGCALVCESLGKFSGLVGLRVKHR